MGYLTIESGLPDLLSVLSFSCSSSAQSGSHLTHTPCHTCTSVGQLQCQCQNIIHRAISSPPAPCLLSSPRSLSHLLLHHLSSCQSSICTLTWSLTQTNPSKGAHADHCPCTERRRDGKGRFCRMLERIERGWGKRELENREGKKRVE